MQTGNTSYIASRLHRALYIASETRGEHEHDVRDGDLLVKAWILREREALLQTANEERARLGKAGPLTMEQIKAAEAKALYQNDYGRTLARTVAELVIA